MPSGVLAVLALLLGTLVVAGVAVAMSATDVGRGVGTAASQAQKITPAYWQAVQRLPTHGQARMSAIPSSESDWSAELLPNLPMRAPRHERQVRLIAEPISTPPPAAEPAWAAPDQTGAASIPTATVEEVEAGQGFDQVNTFWDRQNQATSSPKGRVVYGSWT